MKEVNVITEKIKKVNELPGQMSKWPSTVLLITITLSFRYIEFHVQQIFAMQFIMRAFMRCWALFTFN